MDHRNRKGEVMSPCPRGNACLLLPFLADILVSPDTAQWRLMRKASHFSDQFV